MSPKKQQPDGIIAWHPDRLSRNMRDAGEIIEILDEGTLKDLHFAMYSFHNDSSGKEHLAMEFARAKGYSDHLQDDVFRGTMRQESLGKRTKHLSPAYTIVDDEGHPDYGKIIPSKFHKHWRDAYRWKLERKNNEEIANLMINDGYRPKHKYKKKLRSTVVDKDHVGLHLKNPLHCGWLIPKKSKEPRRADLNEIYPELYNGEPFPIVVSLEDFKRVNPQLFSDTAKKPRNSGRRGSYALSGKLYCKTRQDSGEELCTLIGQASHGGSGKPVPRYACQRCTPTHSVNKDKLYEAVGVAMKGIKLSEREHKKLVVTEWVRYQQDRQQEDATRRQLTILKSRNEKEIRELRETLNAMKYGADRASQAEIKIHEGKLKRLNSEQKSMLERENNLNEESMTRYHDLDAFLELAKNASKWWKKADETQKTKMADLLILNVVVEGNEVTSISLNEPFAGWAKRSKDGDGGRRKT